MKKEKTIQEIEHEIKVLEECVKLGEAIKSEGLILQKFGNRLSIARDYSKLPSNTKLTRLAR